MGKCFGNPSDKKIERDQLQGFHSFKHHFIYGTPCIVCTYDKL